MKSHLTLKVSGLYAWEGRGDKARRVWQSLPTRAMFKHAQCTGQIQVPASAERLASLAEVSEELKTLPQVRTAGVVSSGDGKKELVVHSVRGLVTNHDRQNFAQVVQQFLATKLATNVEVEYTSPR